MSKKPVTPSRIKFRKAKAFLPELQKVFGRNLKAVLVYGSTALNMAKPESDIDIALVLEREASEKDIRQLERLLNAPENREIQIMHVSRKNFENGHIRNFHVGAIPIFGEREYLERMKGKAFSLPSKGGIQFAYLRWEHLGKGGVFLTETGKVVNNEELAKRTAFKRRPVNFAERIKRV